MHKHVQLNDKLKDISTVLLRKYLFYADLTQNQN